MKERTVENHPEEANMKRWNTVPALALAALAVQLTPGAGVAQEQDDREAITAATRAFSQAYMDKDWDAIGAAYTEDGVAIPGGGEPVQRRDAIRALFELPDEIVIIHHRIIPTELVILDDHAYDWGTYEFQSTRDGEAGELRRGSPTCEFGARNAIR